MPIYDNTYNYRIPGHNIDSQCRLLIPSLDSTPAISEAIGYGIKVIVSELPKNVSTIWNGNERVNSYMKKL